VGAHLPYQLLYLLAWDHGPSRAVLAIHAQALLDFYRDQARSHGIPEGRTRTLTVIQRFGGGLNLNVRFTLSPSTGSSSGLQPGRSISPWRPPGPARFITGRERCQERGLIGLFGPGEEPC